MEYQVKKDLVNDFLKENGYEWFRTWLYYGLHWLDAEDAKDGDFKYNREHKVYLNGKQHYIIVNESSFRISQYVRDEDYGLKLCLVAELSENWIDYLLENDKDYQIYYLENSEIEIRKLEENIQKAKDAYLAKVDELNKRIDKVNERKNRITR